MPLPCCDARRNGIQVVPKSHTELNQKNRIIEALGSGSHIPRVQEGPLFRYYKYLTEHLRFPFIAHFPKPMNSEEEDEFCCTVLQLLDPAKHLDDGFDGIFCKTRKGYTRSTCRSSTCTCPKTASAFN